MSSGPSVRFDRRSPGKSRTSCSADSDSPLRAFRRIAEVVSTRHSADTQKHGELPHVRNLPRRKSFAIADESAKINGVALRSPVTE